MLTDTHCHLDDDAFKDDLDDVISRAKAADIGFICDPGTTIKSSERAIEIAEKYDIVYAAVGIHPEDCADYVSADTDKIRELAAHDKVLAIGEIGLDYHWDDNPPRSLQQDCFVDQLEMAGEIGLPVIIHDRDAHGDALELVRHHFNPEAGGVFHCYSGSVETAKLLLDLGFYLGFDGPLTFKNNKKSPEVVAYAPADRLLVETDSPYMAPVPMRGKRNEAAYVRYVVQKMAEIKGVPADAWILQTTENAKHLFHFAS